MSASETVALRRAFEKEIAQVKSGLGSIVTDGLQRMGELASQQIDARQEEHEETLAFLRRHDRDQLLGIAVPPLAELIAALEKGEHRR